MYAKYHSSVVSAAKPDVKLNSRPRHDFMRIFLISVWTKTRGGVVDNPLEDTTYPGYGHFSTAYMD